MKIVVLSIIAASLVTPVQTQATTTSARSVIAIVGEDAVNVLHADFATPDGSTPALPASAPDPTVVSLPSQGSFAERKEAVQAGDLGHLQPGTLYQVAGTRLLLFRQPALGDEHPVWDVFGDTASDPAYSVRHGTGVVSAAGGRIYGSNPEALIVVTLGATQPNWEWIAAQHWIDVVSASYWTVASCPEADPVASMVAEGRALFASAGNYDTGAITASPNMLPGMFRVGVVDEDGDSRITGPDHDLATDEEDPVMFAGWNASWVTRPYEAAERYMFPAATGTAFEGSGRFGATSGATPLVAGRVAWVIAQTRALVGDAGTGARNGALVVASASADLPDSGPLADGTLTWSELRTVVHQASIPALDPSPARYWVEGYGWFNAAAMNDALSIIAGANAGTDRTDDDAGQSMVDAMQQAVTARCAIEG
jgi:hypothetical protein